MRDKEKFIRRRRGWESGVVEKIACTQFSGIKEFHGLVQGSETPMWLEKNELQRQADLLTFEGF